jgi:hypothetical protein
MLVIQVTPLEATDTALLGARCDEAESAGNRVNYTLYARPGEKLFVPVIGVARLGQARWNG